MIGPHEVKTTVAEGIGRERAGGVLAEEPGVAESCASRRRPNTGKIELQWRRAKQETVRKCVF